ncbi:hypothetical protein BRC96_01065 [Halobacteriales archaeon QS_6_64_34]|nr:MAG: hypothetical protein BRC96_01065 [Halobacteriales archaeon QS_6_64_34]
MPANVDWKDDSHEEGLPPREAPVDPKYAVGQSVELAESDHDRFKRRPDYAENAVGTIDRVHGAYHMPTEDGEKQYEYLYSVMFTHKDIWGEDHPESNGTLSLDLWEKTLKSI